MSGADFNAALGAIGVIGFGIFSLWFPSVILRLPVPDGPLASIAVIALWQTVALVILPYLWATGRLGMRLDDLGVTWQALGKSTILGCLLYSIALVAFIHCSEGRMMSDHSLRSSGPGEAALLVSLMGLVAAGTDMTTRGFVLLVLARHSPIIFAIAMQNLIWFTGHVHEIKQLADCLGIASAAALTLTLGILGDLIVLRTGNVLGLAIAHVMLNIILAVYLRAT